MKPKSTSQKAIICTHIAMKTKNPTARLFPSDGNIHDETHIKHRLQIMDFSTVTPCSIVGGSVLKMEAACSFKTLVTTYKTAWCHS
jgi:hypothetical protein